MTTRQPRAGFTLIELLVVIAIIGVLVGLAVFGIIPLLRKGPDLRDASDIQQLQTALQEFKNKFGVYPPSKIKLYSSRTGIAPFSAYSTDTTPLAQESLAYLNRIWPRLGDFSGIKWNGTGLQTGVILEGDQCLVFFLGGPQGTEGFTTSQSNPIPDPTIPGDRIKFFEFQAGRLKDRGGNGFPSYVDNWQDPNNNHYFVYFTSGKKANSYDDTHAISFGTDSVAPVYSTTTPSKKYYNPNTFQIIAPGGDGLYGGIGQWNNGAAAGTGWQDNRTNFHPNQLQAGS